MKRILIPQAEKANFAPSLPESATSALAANEILRIKNPIAILLEESLPKAEEWAEDTAALMEEISSSISIDFQTFDHPPIESNPDAFERSCERTATLSSLLGSRKTNSASDKKTITLIATTPDSILGPCPPPEDRQKSETEINKGNVLDFDEFCLSLAENLGYSSEILCEEPGQFSIRGGLVDVYPVNGREPVRIDFFGNEVEEIRAFDPTTQRTTEQLSGVTIASSGPMDTYGREGEFFRYLIEPVTWVLREPEKLVSLYPLVFHETDNKKGAKANFSLSWASKGKNHFIGTSELSAGAGIFEESDEMKSQVFSLSDFRTPPDHSSISLERLENQKFSRTSFLFHLLQKQKQKHEVIIAAGADSERKRITEIIREESSLEKLNPRFLPIGLREGFSAEPGKESNCFSLLKKNPEKGIVLATAREILGRERSRRSSRTKKAIVRRKEVDQALDFSELVQDDYLVHHQHGICRFRQLGKIEEENRKEEAITLEFADGILLHVPLQESHLLSRYVGLQKAKPKLAKLGGKAWAKTKQAAELAALDLAADLLRLQATRETQKGYAFAADDQWQKEFEDAFPFTETPDQQKAIDQTKIDMEKEEPMDRLVCGDVGFGKTEVALRAAFKAVMDGKQVALLAPTTILCQQHLNVFRERMADYPIEIEMLTRFRTSKEQRKILRCARDGTIDILIGTHRILGKDLVFLDLGLLVVDEEQRFGVQHKETIKRLRVNVDVLTLSATPIPRTLYFAMVGARALSAIETPPVNRRSIRTEVAKNSPEVVKRAVEMELRRGGQVFYLHNRVKTIASVARKLQAHFPEIRIAVGHGQMEENELEKVMTEFVAGDHDLLVCTTIIESGLDIPNCNTIIIEGADKFGLSQLYQLRGRVGRFNRQAYAYLLLNMGMPVSDLARKRLSAIRQTNNFGAGFRIALRDLELRGAGNLLGSEQSGHVAGIGFELYCRLLKESVSRLKGDDLSLRLSATVRLDFLVSGETEEEEASEIHGEIETEGAFFPENYTAEARLRIEGYRRLSRIQTLAELSEFEEELRDRFGSPPGEVDNLLSETKIRCLSEEAGFDQIEVKGSELFCRFVRNAKDKEKKYLRIAGRIPKLSARKPLLKLKEIIRFLKIRVHGNKND
ncbi:MAG: transcription-repair coupling factor [Opitutae bacterium]|nr:transcription-repair coupling factor [Opitutae bacterium]